LTLAVFALFAFGLRAQTVGSSSLITGTNYFPILISPGIYQTNQIYQAGAYKPVTLGNIASTNETVTAYYIVNPTNGLVPVPNLPGWFFTGNGYTNSFASGTNGGSYSFNFNGTGQTVLCPAQLMIALTGTNLNGSPVTNSAYVP